MAKGRRDAPRPRGRLPHGSHAGTRPKQRGLITGTLRVNSRGSGTVETPEGVLVVPSSRIHEAMNGDSVQVRLFPSERSGADPVASVTHVLDRANVAFAARFEKEGGLEVLVPLDDRLCHDFVLPPEDTSARDLGVRSGDIVSARIARYPTRRDAGQAVIERIIGDGENTSVAIEAIIAAHDLAVEFSPEAVAQAEGMRFDLAAALAEPSRRDIRDRFMVTIDPDDARDYDDAVSIEALEGGGWLLGVHIADVSAYVGPSSAIDLDARARATSVYLADRVLPMLPERLSCDLCSLKPGTDRLAMTVDLVLDTRGRVRESSFYPSIVRSDARLRYREADDVLEAVRRGDAGLTPWVGDVSLGAFLGELDRVRRLRESMRRERGSIEFVTVEAKAVLDESGRPTSIDVRRRTPATMLVEEAMLAANEAVARKLGASGVPAAFRVHEPPAADALAAIVPRLRELGCLSEPRARAAFMLGDPHAVQSVLDDVRDKPADQIVSTMLLRSMRRAVYSPFNDGHFGLGADAYCHFTSPIRRYPDLVVHRALKAAVGAGDGADARRVSKDQMATICAHSSKMERVAAAAGAESQAVKIAEYMEARIGQVFSGVVCGVHPFGLFVRLDETCAEGLLHVRDLGGGWWDYDEGRSELVRDGDGRVYRLGQALAVRVRSCDPFRGRIDFSLPQQ